MASRSEQAIDAVTALVTSAVPLMKVGRNLDTPERLPAGGLVIIRDGDPGEAEITLSPLTYTYAHAVRVEIGVVGDTPDTRADALDEALVLIGAAIEADRTLNGLCEWMEPSTADRSDLRAAGSATSRWADFDIVVVYSTPNPLT